MVRDEHRARLLDFGGKRVKARTIAVNDTFDEDCRCTDAVSYLQNAALDGGYAYTSRIYRVRIADAGRKVTSYVPPVAAQGFDVDRGRIAFTGWQYGMRGVWLERHPTWATTAESGV